MYAYMLTGAYTMALAGAILFAVGYFKLPNLAKALSYVELELDVVDVFIVTCGLFCLFTDTILLVGHWFMADEDWIRVKNRYYLLMGDEMTATTFEWSSRYHFSWKLGKLPISITLPRFGPTQHAIGFAFLILSMIISVMMASVGVYELGSSYYFGGVCRDVVEALDGICLRIPWLSDSSSSEIRCGPEFEQFCQDWSKKEMAYTLWGGFTSVIGHFYLTAFSAMAAFRSKGVSRALDLYPTSQKEYITYLQKIGTSNPFEEEDAEEEPEEMVLVVQETDDNEDGDSKTNTSVEVVNTMSWLWLGKR